MILVEKYRPKEFEDVIGVDSRITKNVGLDMPHFLFVGSPGTGKTTTAKIIIEKLGCDSLTLNASDERGINIIREKVKTFAMTKSSNKKFKIIFLDEADKLTPDAMDSLRNLMETYHSNCRFILSGNYENKFTDAMDSRLVKIKFTEPNKEEIYQRLKKICELEKIQIFEDALKLLIERSYPDLRKMINKLQELSAKSGAITISDIKKEERIVEQLLGLIKTKKVFDARQLLLDKNVDYDLLTEDIYQYVMKNELPPTTKLVIVKMLCEYARFSNTVMNKEMLFFEFIIKTSASIGV